MDTPSESASSSYLELRPGAASLAFDLGHSALRDFNKPASSSIFPLYKAHTPLAYFPQWLDVAGAEQPAIPDLAVSGSQPAPPVNHYLPAPVINRAVPVQAVMVPSSATLDVEVTPFSGELHELFPQWLEEYETVAAAYGWSRELQLQRIGLYLRGRASDMYRSVTSHTRNEYSAVKEALLAAFTSGARNEAARSRLHHLRQEPTQSAYGFYRDLRDAAAVAYPTMPVVERDRLMLSLFVNGLHISMGKVIFYRGCTTLEEALAVAEQCEANPQFLCEQQQSSFADQNLLGRNPVNTPTDAIESKINALADQVARLCGLLAQSSEDPVGTTNSTVITQAPMLGEPGASYDQTPLVEDRGRTGRDPFQSTSHERPHVYSVGITTDSAFQRPSTLIPLEVNGTMVGSLWDTGASISLISASLACRLHMQLEYAQIGAVTITGAHLPVMGATTATLRFGSYCRALRLYVVTDAAQELVLGTDFLTTLPPVAFDYQRGTVRVGGQTFSLSRAPQLSCSVFSTFATQEVADVPNAASRKCRRRHRRRRNRLPMRFATSSNADISVVGKPEPTLQTAYSQRHPAVQTEHLAIALTAQRPWEPPAETPVECIASSEKDLPLLNPTTTYHDSTLDGPEMITPISLDSLHTNRVVVPQPRLKHRIANVVQDVAPCQNRQLAVQDVSLSEACTGSPCVPNCLQGEWDPRPRPRPRTSVATVGYITLQTGDTAPDLTLIAPPTDLQSLLGRSAPLIAYSRDDSLVLVSDTCSSSRITYSPFEQRALSAISH